jgi:hypothetical protein
MISRSFSSEWAMVHVSRLGFCCISRARAATPPALAALPGAKRTSASANARTASGVVGMLAPSTTVVQPFLMRAAASASVSSFCVALGIATSQGKSQTRRSATNLACGTALTYSPIRARWTSLRSLSTSRLMPLSSWMKPEESEQATTVPPSWCTFSIA